MAASEKRLKLTLKRGPSVVTTVHGMSAVAIEQMSMQELNDVVLATEANLEKLLGLRAHIEVDGGN